MSVSNAKRLLAEAAEEVDRLRRHLLVAAAIRSATDSEPVVVGGTAEDFWTADEYHETDLDMCGLAERHITVLGELGFTRSGRHWEHPEVAVAVEFPASTLDGDMERTVLEDVGSGAARLIGLDDLYLDRLRQATMQEHVEGAEFHSALAVLAAGFDIIDRPYVRRRLDLAVATERLVGEAMTRLDARLRRRVLRALS